MKTDFERRDKSSFWKKKFPSFPSLFHFQKSMIKDRSMDFFGKNHGFKGKMIFVKIIEASSQFRFHRDTNKDRSPLNQKKKMEKWNLNRAIHNPHAESYKLAGGSAIDWFENVMACADDSSIMSLSVNDKPELLATRYIGELLLFLFFFFFNPL